MALSDFDLRTALRSFGLTEGRDADLFAGAAALEPSPFLQVWLDEFAPVAVGVNTEKARSEFIIAPFLAEACRRSVGPVTVLPGIDLDVDRARGLSGFCDFVIARSPEVFFLRGPLVAVVQAKREDLVGGLGQCAASMVALREFNERDGTPVESIHGVVTSGTNWSPANCWRSTGGNTTCRTPRKSWVSSCRSPPAHANFSPIRVGRGTHARPSAPTRLSTRTSP